MVFIADGREGLRIFNVSNPSKPAEIGSLAGSLREYAEDVLIEDGYAYLANSSGVDPGGSCPRYAPMG